jgi:hypothetical protein
MIFKKIKSLFIGESFEWLTNLGPDQVARALSEKAC